MKIGKTKFSIFVNISRLMMNKIFLLLIVFNAFVFNSYAIDKEKEAKDLLKLSNEMKDKDKSKSMSLLNKALDLYQKENDFEGLANTYTAISNWYINESQWDTSLSLSLRALKFGNELNDSSIKSKVYLNLGIIYFNLQNYSTSTQYSKKAISFGSVDTKASATSNLGMIYSKNNKPDSAFLFFKTANELFLSLKDTSSSVLSNIAITYMNMGTIALEKKDYGSAKKYFNKSLVLCYRIRNYNSIILNYLNFGRVFIEEKNFVLAEEVIERSMSIADSVGLPYLSNLSMYALSELYFTKGDYKFAYQYLLRHYVVKDSLNGLDIANKIANLQMKYEVEHQQQQICILENNQKLNAYKTLLYVVITIFLASLVIFYLNKRRLNVRKRMAQAEQIRKETQVKLKKAKEDIIHYTKLIQENNQRIECFEEELLNSNRNSEELQEKQEKLRGMKILKDEDWVYYKLLFKEVYANFYDKVMCIPNLTEGDKRQVLLLKLGYTNKMSADVLGISTDGIKRARQRLAKKLNLIDAGKLEDYFNNL